MLIIDSGSTKADWAFLKNGGNTTFSTAGINPLFHSADQIHEALNGNPELAVIQGQVEQVYFYGASCSNAGRIAQVKDALSRLIPGARIEVTHDLMGAARATCGNTKGFVCILGSGSSAGYYDGKIIHRKTRSLGYILGDEGSGAYFGKKIVTDYLYQRLTNKLQDAFQKKYPEITVDSVLDRIYQKHDPNRFMASFMLFLADHRASPYVQETIRNGFAEFLKIHVSPFMKEENVPVHFNGSVAYHFKEELMETMSNLQLTVGNIIQNPMAGLIAYHSQ